MSPLPIFELEIDKTKEPFINNKLDIALALYHHRQINDEGKRWARLDMDEHHIWLYIGVIMTNGKKECCLITRQYILEEGNVFYYDSLAL